MVWLKIFVNIEGGGFLLMFKLTRRYFQRMTQAIRSELFKVVKYVSTPLHFCSLCALCDFTLILLSRSIGLPCSAPHLASGF